MRCLILSIGFNQKLIDGPTLSKILKTRHDMNQGSPRNPLVVLVSEYERPKSSNELKPNCLKALKILKTHIALNLGCKIQI